MLPRELSDLLEGMVLCPTELVKCRLQAAKQMGQEDAGVISTVRWQHMSHRHRSLEFSHHNVFTEIFSYLMASLAFTAA